MEPKDLKNPEGLKSTQTSEEGNSGKTAASNEQVKQEEKAVKAESEIQEKQPETLETSENKQEQTEEEEQVTPGGPVSSETEKKDPEEAEQPEDEGLDDRGEKEEPEEEQAPETTKEPETTEEKEEVESKVVEAEEKQSTGMPAEEEELSDTSEEVPAEPVMEVEEEKTEEVVPAEGEVVDEKKEQPLEEEAGEAESETGEISTPDGEGAGEAEESPKVEKAPEVEEESPKEEESVELQQVDKEEGPVAESVSKEEASEESPEGTDETEQGEEKEEASGKLAPEEEKADEIKAEEREERKEERKKTKVVKREKPDYTTFTQIELVNTLRDVLESNGDHDVKDDVEEIKAAFYKHVKDEIEEQKKKFLEEGGEEEDFQEEENPYEQDIKDLLKRYRQIRHEFNKKLDEEKEINLQLKYDIIEDIKGLIHKEESINKTFQEFRDLQQRWREIGLVPQSKMKDLWDTYHFHVESFYDYIKINKELRDLDLKKNLEMKIRLCEQAEELLLETNIIKAFNALQKLHERWREIGPVPRENKDDIWERFKASTAKINKKHQEYFENRKTEQKKNLEAKRALCEQVEEINELELATHKDWADKSKEVVNLQKVWRTIGFAPRKDNNKIFKRFREACDSFFDAKREFYSKNKELQQNNLQLKIDLCMQAEALKDSIDWRKTTQDLINIQKQWKEIGPVSRKHSDVLWKRFRAACDYFFDKKSEHFSNIDSEQVDNLKDKEQLVEDVESFEPSDNADENLRNLKEFQRRWTEIGHVPIKKKDEIQRRFREAIDKLFDDLKLDESKRNLLKFRSKMASFSESSRGQNKMRFERDKYMSKLKQLENDLVLLDNNIGFFAKSKNAESLIEDVKQKIEQTKEKIELLKDKIRVIDEMDQSEE
ncbi:DUF349 domain-containing protein [Mariniphaga sediminis]|jgi:hypothetical protein|uniref:DUF349 domain-containing protein n=1 Tax=Mariniphaga sediminis TaxID=1628158 RepID=UPI00356AAF5F